MEEKILLDMCEETLKMLSDLQKQGKITKAEYKEHTKVKCQFIENYSNQTNQNITYAK